MNKYEYFDMKSMRLILFFVMQVIERVHRQEQRNAERDEELKKRQLNENTRKSDSV
jgi:hypothetical protein